MPMRGNVRERVKIFQSVALTKYMIKFPRFQFIIFKPLNNFFEETIEFEVKASFARTPVSPLIKLGDIKQEF